MLLHAVVADDSRVQDRVDRFEFGMDLELFWCLTVRLDSTVQVIIPFTLPELI